MPHFCLAKAPLQPVLAAMLLAGIPLAALAQTPPNPNAGSILQQSQPGAVPAPSSRGTGLRLEQPAGGEAPVSAPFKVNKLQITGNALFETGVLFDLVKEAEGQTLSLAQLQAYAARITDFYRNKGYPLARAILPAQVIRDGVVIIQVIEARYGAIKLNNTSRVRDSLLRATMAGMQAGAAIDQAGLDRSLLLLSDIPGVKISGGLKPGAGVGNADLEVNAEPGPMVTGDAAIDNYGNRFTGRPRLRGSFNVNNLLGYGDVLGVSGFTAGSLLNYGRASYDTLVNGHGTRLGGSYAALKYTLGGPLSSLSANGTAGIGSLWAKHPLVRGRDVNLYGQVQFDDKELRDRIDSTRLKTDRKLRNLTFTLSGDARDGFMSGGLNLWNLSWTGGRVAFDDPAARISDAATARTEGRFSKLSLFLARIQSLSPGNSLYVALSGQFADTNLDSSEKMSLGGAYTVRAYDTGAISGDTGALVTLELRHALGAVAGGQLQAVGFVDSGRVSVNKSTFAAGVNNASLTGVGVGFNWEGPSGWNAKAYVATPVGSTPILIGQTKSARGWVEVGVRF